MRSVALNINRRIFYGWIILAVAALGIFVSGPGQSHTFSVFLVHIQADLGLSATAVSSAYAFATLVAAFGLPLMGKLLDRIGPRQLLLSVTLCGWNFMARGGIRRPAVPGPGKHNVGMFQSHRPLVRPAPGLCP